MKLLLFLVLVYFGAVWGKLSYSRAPDLATRRIDMVVDVITLNLKENGWSTIICFGHLPDEFYIKLKNISFPFAITNIDREDEEIEDIVHYYANTIVIDLLNIASYGDTLSQLKDFPYWHPHANIIVYYHEQDRSILPKIFFSLWYNKVVNVIIVQYDDSQELLHISHFTPFTSEHYKLDHVYGCWTTKRIGMPVSSFEEGFACVEQCHNVSINSKLRANNLGTCLSFSTISVPYNASNALPGLNLFEDKSKDLHGFQLRAYATMVEPFIFIDNNGNGTYTLRSRDGLIWSSMAKLMNFTIHLIPTYEEMTAAFNFERNINQLFSFAHRKADLYLVAIYLFDVVVVEIDYTFPFKDSGVCVVSHRAGFVTTFFDLKTLHTYTSITLQFAFCFLGIWLTFSIYHGVDKRNVTFDQIGKDFLNAVRNVLSLTLYNPPQRHSLRIFLSVTIWSFFVFNFATQATIVSFLTAAKRGKEVDTFQDMIDTGYHFYGMASPDLILPDTEERFRTINSRLVPIQDLFGCAKQFSKDIHRLCMIDCAVARYIMRNWLNKHGEQYLHIAKDRIHSNYLTMFMIKHSPLTDRFNKYQMMLYEAGLLKKWEQYRFTDIKEEAPVKPLGMDDFKSIFKVYCFSLAFTFLVFVLELILFHSNKLVKICLKKKNRM